MKWTRCANGLETGAYARWFFATLDGAWALFDRATDELVAGPWASDTTTIEQAQAAAEAMIAAREPCVPDGRFS